MDVIGRNGSIPEGRDGREKGRPLGEKREERREKREERETSTITIIRSKDVIGRNGSIPEWRVWGHNSTSHSKRI